MLKEKNEQINFLVRTADLVICVLAFFGAYWIRTSELFFQSPGIESLANVSWTLVASIIFHFLIYPQLGFYQSLRLRSWAGIIRIVFLAALIEFALFGTIVFMIQAKETSRVFVGIFLLINYGLVLVERVGARVMLSQIRTRGYNYRQVLIVGTGQNAARLIEVLRTNKHWGYVPFGLLRGPHDELVQDVLGVPLLGDVKSLETVVRDRAVDEVYFAPDQLNPGDVKDEVLLCEKLGIPSRFSLAYFDFLYSKSTFNWLGDLPVITFYTNLRTPVQVFTKRIVDIAVALVGLAITAVLYPWISRRIRKESPGPVIFKQIRVGENGRLFKCYKFRTMALDADSRKQELMDQNLMQGPIFKLANDPRVTPFGAYLRRTSLDELPQFLNVIRGEMSIVGTRPPTQDEVVKYETHYRKRLSVRPGITGLWQVSGRNSVQNFEDILTLDVKYIDNWSVLLDFKIIFKTIWVVLSRRGAH